jgi:copper(I)-binding protein
VGLIAAADFSGPLKPATTKLSPPKKAIGQAVELKLGSYRLMFNGLRGSLNQGQTIKGTLQFEKAGSIEVEFQVAPIGAKGAELGGQMHMQH